MNGTHHDHVLIVEDELRIAAVLEDYLANAGYTHHWVADGAAVLQAFHAERPDLVLLDRMLPGRDGIDLFHELRRHGHVPCHYRHGQSRGNRPLARHGDRRGRLHLQAFQCA